MEQASLRIIVSKIKCATISVMASIQQEMISKITDVLEHDSRVVAAWLEGSIARAEDDEWSDIDLWIAVRDADFAEFVDERERFAAKLGDVVSVLYPKTLEQDDDVDSFQIILEDLPTTLTIDVDVQHQSRQFRFTKDSRAEECKVLFDKDHVVQYQAKNTKQIHTYAKRIADDLLTRSWHRAAKIPAYIEREDMLEATNRYLDCVLDLITLYRAVYTPEKIDWGWKDIEYDLPKDAVNTLYALLPDGTLKGLSKHLRTFHKALHHQCEVVEKQLHLQPPYALIEQLTKH